VATLEQGLGVAGAALAGGVSIVEMGTPLLKNEGVSNVVPAFRRKFPEALSWDGQTLYYLRPVGGAQTLFAMPLPRGPERPLGIQVSFWNYVPAEHGLYYMTLGQGQRAPFTYEVRFFDSASGQSRVVHRVRLAQVSPGLTVTRDGKTVVIEGVAVVTQDLVRIENFR
jgi:hypothetical protein